ncbi:uncharacterized protein LOC125122979 [Phacochoerus africanus]|uniref:uncharacterized protein LOC125122979 n=1 Tax=Phacochoerus africanus TaxID=41426 RepID=UPI001FD9FF2F|nr:uncharacterized protein LOC125122979 [Phacochoerus africanus]
MDAPHKDASVARAFDLPPGASRFYKLGHASGMPAPAGDSRGDGEPELTAAAAGSPRLVPPGPPRCIPPCPSLAPSSPLPLCTLLRLHPAFLPAPPSRPPLGACAAHKTCFYKSPALARNFSLLAAAAGSKVTLRT